MHSRTDFPPHSLPSCVNQPGLEKVLPAPAESINFRFTTSTDWLKSTSSCSMEGLSLVLANDWLAQLCWQADPTSCSVRACTTARLLCCLCRDCECTGSTLALRPAFATRCPTTGGADALTVLLLVLGSNIALSHDDASCQTCFVVQQDAMHMSLCRCVPQTATVTTTTEISLGC